MSFILKRLFEKDMCHRVCDDLRFSSEASLQVLFSRRRCHRQLRPALASIRHLKSHSAERERHQGRVARLRSRLDQAGVAHLDNPSHIVPVMVCDAVLYKQISDVLMDRYGIYVQPINYPTVPGGTERLRITPSPWAEVGLAGAA
jgi:7-keto-8-aminopelargonate synthetase-like enzyme